MNNQMVTKIARCISALSTSLLGVLLAFNLYAGDVELHQELPAGIVKIPLNILAGTPKIEFSQDKNLIVSATVIKARMTEAVLFRFLLNGKLDTAFGNAGMVTARADGSHAAIRSLVTRSLAIQPDGKIIMAGWAKTGKRFNSDFLLMRYLSDGRPDMNLGGGGWTITNLGRSIDEASDVMVQADNKIVAVGISAQSFMIISRRFDFAIVRYLPDGRLDPQFAKNGKAIFRVGNTSEDFANAVKQDHAGRIVVAGMSRTRYAGDMTILRVANNGELDKTFGKGGTVITRFGESASAAASIVIQPDTKIVVAGALHNPSSGSVVVMYDDSGELDNGFGTAGIVRLPWVSGLQMVKTQRDGKIVLLGTRNSTSQKWAAMIVVRMNPDGTLDKTFGDNGTASVELNSHLIASGMAISDSNQIFVCGMAGQRYQDLSKDLDNGLILFKLTHRGELDERFGR